MRSSRPDRGPATSPPLAVWAAVAAASALLFLLSLSAFNRYDAADKTFYDASARRLAAFAARKGGAEKKLRVMAIGSSVMGKAVFIDADMEAFAKGHGLDGLEFMRLTMPVGNIMDFMPLMDDIYGAAPDIILIEAASAINDRHLNTNRFARKYTAFLKTILMDGLKTGRPAWPAPGKAHAEEDFDLPISANWAPPVDTLIAHWNNRSLIGIRKSAPFFAEAARRGIHVVLIEIPRHPAFKGRASEMTAQETALLRTLREDYGVRVVAFTGGVNAGHFSDLSHFNEKGRIEFSLWLVDALKKGAGVI